METKKTDIDTVWVALAYFLICVTLTLCNTLYLDFVSHYWDCGYFCHCDDYFGLGNDSLHLYLVP